MRYIQTPNFDNRSTPSLGFIIHGTQGSFDGAVEWLCTPPEKRQDKSYSSAHFVVAKTGAVTQLADIKTRTWHAGTVNKPDAYAQSVLPKTLGVYKNPNDNFIGIELEWFDGDTITTAQYDSVVEIIKSSGIIDPIILTHTQVTSYKSDFGDYSKVILENIKSKLNGSPQKSKETIKAEIIKLVNQL